LIIKDNFNHLVIRETETFTWVNFKKSNYEYILCEAEDELIVGLNISKDRFEFFGTGDGIVLIEAEQIILK